jgi:hypothetical protein
MIKIPVVGGYDADTKRRLLGGRGAIEISLDPNIRAKSFSLYITAQIWPSSSMAEITHGFSDTRYGNPWLVPIDIGDGIKISPIEFAELLLVQYPEETNSCKLTIEEAMKYFRQITDEDVEVYKLMVKMKKLEEKRKY